MTLLSIAKELARQLEYLIPYLMPAARESGNLMGLVINSRQAIHELTIFECRSPCTHEVSERLYIKRVTEIKHEHTTIRGTCTSYLKVPFRLCKICDEIFKSEILPEEN